MTLTDCRRSVRCELKCTTFHFTSVKARAQNETRSGCGGWGRTTTPERKYVNSIGAYVSQASVEVRFRIALNDLWHCCSRPGQRKRPQTERQPCQPSGTDTSNTATKSRFVLSEAPLMEFPGSPLWYSICRKKNRLYSFQTLLWSENAFVVCSSQ